LWTLRVDAQADERCPAELLLPVLAVDRALYPDGAALQHRIHTTLGEHRHVSRREMRHHRDRIFAIGGIEAVSYLRSDRRGRDWPSTLEWPGRGAFPPPIGRSANEAALPAADLIERRSADPVGDLAALGETVLETGGSEIEDAGNAELRPPTPEEPKVCGLVWGFFCQVVFWFVAGSLFGGVSR
jgi:hypothetical protein